MVEIKYLQFIENSNGKMLCNDIKIGYSPDFEEFIFTKDELIREGRYSVLKEFHYLCEADAFIGFSDEEWRAIKKFFNFNEKITNFKIKK